MKRSSHAGDNIKGTNMVLFLFLSIGLPEKVLYTKLNQERRYTND